MKKLIAFSLSLAMLLSLCACGSKTTTSESPSESPSESSNESSSETETASEPEIEPATEEPVETAIPIQCGESIDVENFSMSFDSVELLSEYSYSTSAYGGYTSLYVENGYKLVLAKGHFENKSTSTISSYNSFVLTALVNNSYEVDGYDVHLDFIRDKDFEIDPYTDLDYVLYINIPEKLADMFETVTFTIGFNDDMSAPTTVWNNDGTKTTETDNVYTFTSGLSSNDSASGIDADTTNNSSTAEEVWSVEYYVDDFEQPTDQWYISNYSSGDFVGKFSNSATTDSKLLVQFLIDQENIAIVLLEYGKNVVKNSSTRSVVTYDITIRTADGADHEMTGTLYCGGDRIVIDDAYKSSVYDMFCQEGDIIFRIVESERPTTTYLFTAKTANFGELYQSLI
jgi:predicted small lipoprotein YifL